MVFWFVFRCEYEFKLKQPIQSFGGGGCAGAVCFSAVGLGEALGDSGLVLQRGMRSRPVNDPRQRQRTISLRRRFRPADVLWRGAVISAWAALRAWCVSGFVLCQPASRLRVSYRRAYQGMLLNARGDAQANTALLKACAEAQAVASGARGTTLAGGSVPNWTRLICAKLCSCRRWP